MTDEGYGEGYEEDAASLTRRAVDFEGASHQRDQRFADREPETRAFDVPLRIADLVEALTKLEPGTSDAARIAAATCIPTSIVVTSTG